MLLVYVAFYSLKRHFSVIETLRWHITNFFIRAHSSEKRNILKNITLSQNLAFNLPITKYVLLNFQGQ